MSALLDDYLIGDTGSWPAVAPQPRPRGSGDEARPALRLVAWPPADHGSRVPAVKGLGDSHTVALPGRRAAGAPSSRPLQLTRRGVVALSGAVVGLALALGVVAWLSAPDSAASGAASGGAGAAATVVVAPGDSLWSIATRVAPDRDPRAEVSQLQHLNHLSGSTLVPGQVLHTR